MPPPEGRQTTDTPPTPPTPVTIKARVLQHGCTIGAYVHAAGALVDIPSPMAKALADLGKVEIIGA